MSTESQDWDPFQRTIAALLARVAGARDRAAFLQLYRLTAPRLNALVTRILRDERLAEDVLQEVYLTIWNRSESYSSGRAKPMTWMIAIARNRAIDRLRQNRTSAPVHAPIDDIDVADQGLLPLDAMLEHERGQALKSCIEALEERQRGMIMAAFYDGFTYDELARRLGVPLSTMKSWIRRGLARLRHCLDQRP